MNKEPKFWIKYKSGFDPYYGDTWAEHIKFLKSKVKGLNGRLLCIDCYANIYGDELSTSF